MSDLSEREQALARGYVRLLQVSRRAVGNAKNKDDLVVITALIIRSLDDILEIFTDSNDLMQELTRIRDEMARTITGGVN